MVNISYIRLLNAFEAFSNAHLQIRRFAADFPEQLPNFGTESEKFPILFVSPDNTIFDENANQFTVTVSAFDILEKDRSNINTVLSDTNTILNDVYRWFKDGDIFGIDVIDETPNSTPINNALLDFAAGWEMQITFTVDTYGICEIPFNDAPMVITEVCDIVYSKYLTCDTLGDCALIQEIQSLLPTEDQKAALDAANNPSGANPFATIADLSGGGESLAGTLAIGNTTSGYNIEVSNNDFILGNGSGPGYLTFGANGGNITILTQTNSLTKGAILIQAAKSLGLTFNTSVVTDTNGTPKGLQYAADYSAGYTNRSLVDKEYVDSLTPPASDLAAVLAVGNSTNNIAIVSPDTFSSATIQDNSATVGYDNGTNISFFGSSPLEARVAYTDGTDSGVLRINASNTIFGHSQAIAIDSIIIDITTSDTSALLNVSPQTVLIQANDLASVSASFAAVAGSSAKAQYFDASIISLLELYSGSLLLGTWDQGGINTREDITIFHSAQTITNNGADNHLIITDEQALKGLVYASDYSANFTPESLVSKRYVDALTPVLPTITEFESVVIDGQGGVVANNSKMTIRVPYAGTIVGWSLFEISDTPIASTVTLDAWKSDYASYPPVVGGSIFGTKPALAAAIKNQATGLSIAVAAGDLFIVNVDSNLLGNKYLFGFDINRA